MLVLLSKVMCNWRTKEGSAGVLFIQPDRPTDDDDNGNDDDDNDDNADDDDHTTTKTTTDDDDDDPIILTQESTQGLRNVTQCWGF
jgi:hypothetical protein